MSATKVLFFGTPDFSVPTLQSLLSMEGVCVGAVITQPDKASGRGGIIQPPPIKRLAVAHNIPVFQPTSLRKEFNLLRGHIEALGPFDVGIVIAFGQILPKEVLALPTHGCINIHASLLPRWRGAAPIQRAIEAGDSLTGVCLMQMDEGLDTGAVFSSCTTPIVSTDTGASLHDRLSYEGAALLRRDLTSILSGKLTATPQPQEGVMYAAKITPADREVRWDKPADQISRLIRALSPLPGAFTIWHNKRMKVLAAHAIPGTTPGASTPGRVIPSPDGHLYVSCGNGSVIEVDELQLEGKKRMPASEFLRGTGIPAGTALG